ncbi:hypothetical protein Tsubulata_017257 [Turnera subulata]|uniref:Exostosin GT47 domain-containing protein n=1 Tax=Turnera subulata TaxID=218843 RepID=A0A9Q0F216_9ROSI|nr:hypothetical protein Tsubulata_017257 [Turnera subulata]
MRTREMGSKKKKNTKARRVLMLLFAVALPSFIAISFFMYKHRNNSEIPTLLHHPISSQPYSYNPTNFSQKATPSLEASLFPPPPPPPPPAATFQDLREAEADPYHNWELFSRDFQEMLQHFKIFVYPDIFDKANPFANIFLPLDKNPFQNPRIGNYFSEHIFKISLLNSSVLTSTPRDAHFFYLPFSVNNLRNDPRVRSELRISEYVAEYTSSVARRFGFWNASGGADHFYVCCHSVGRDATSRHHWLHNNVIQVTCSSSYFQRFYVAHKDVGLPQIWPRSHQIALNPPHLRHRLVFFSGRVQNAQVRKQLIDLFGNHSEMDIFNGSSTFSYEEGFKNSRYCLHVKGYEVNTARLSDSIHYGCIPVIISNYYDLPFANVLDWSKFSVTINQRDIPLLRTILLGVTKETYLSMYHNLCKVRRHFVWHMEPRGYDAFHMTVYQLWLRRSIHRLSSL